MSCWIWVDFFKLVIVCGELNNSFSQTLDQHDLKIIVSDPHRQVGTNGAPSPVKRRVRIKQHPWNHQVNEQRRKRDARFSVAEQRKEAETREGGKVRLSVETTPHLSRLARNTLMTTSIASNVSSLLRNTSQACRRLQLQATPSSSRGSAASLGRGSERSKTLTDILAMVGGGS